MWTDDLAEATIGASHGMLLSNDSYGLKTSVVPIQWFGAYREHAQTWDNLMFNAPYYLMVTSAGNDGEGNLNSNPLALGYDKLSGRATAKNNLVVANAKDANIDREGDLVSISIYPSSSQGPTDDLRIKPDITGNGVDVYSTYTTSNTAYGNLTGTSMASPNVTGSLLSLQEHYNNINEKFMRAATLKGLALHTADDFGPDGPDAVSGWGLLNAKRAAETITENGTNSFIEEMILNQGQTITIRVESADDINDLLASISWTDRPGNVNDTLNSPTPALINDLDIQVSKENDTYLPWKLTSATTNEKGNNTVDPFERVDITGASGSYTITLSHKGNLAGGSQAFSLIITGIKIECTTATTPDNLLAYDITDSEAEVSWNPLLSASFDLQYRKTDTDTWTEVSEITTSTYKLTGLDVYKEYQVTVRSNCLSGEASEYSDPINFFTTHCESFSSDPNSNLYISNVTLNTINNNTSWAAHSDFTDISTELIGGQTYTISIKIHNLGYGTNYAVWIDYNGNGKFDDVGEQVFSKQQTDITAHKLVHGTF